MNIIPWQDLMLIGMGVLRLAPEQFWNMTLAELMVLVRMHLPAGARPMMREELDLLMQRFPDL